MLCRIFGLLSMLWDCLIRKCIKDQVGATPCSSVLDQINDFVYHISLRQQLRRGWNVRAGTQSSFLFGKTWSCLRDRTQKNLQSIIEMISGGRARLCCCCCCSLTCLFICLHTVQMLLSCRKLSQLNESVNWKSGIVGAAATNFRLLPQSHFFAYNWSLTYDLCW